MKWKTYKNGWKAKFALFPRNIGGTWIWLEWFDVTEPFIHKSADDFWWQVRYPSQIKNKT